MKYGAICRIFKNLWFAMERRFHRKNVSRLTQSGTEGRCSIRSTLAITVELEWPYGNEKLLMRKIRLFNCSSLNWEFTMDKFRKFCPVFFYYLSEFYTKIPQRLVTQFYIIKVEILNENRFKKFAKLYQWKCSRLLPDAAMGIWVFWSW